MDFFEVIRSRRSIRKYQQRPVEPAKLEQVLEAARLAPSWKNLQCWRFLVLTDPAQKDSMLSAFAESNPGRQALSQAPVVIVVCADPSQSEVAEGKEYYLADAAIAFEHLCLAARALELGTCWVGWFSEAELKQVLGIPSHLRVLGVTPLGYPDQEPKPRPRKALADIVCYNEWGKTLW